MWRPASESLVTMLTTAPRMYIQDDNLGRYGRRFQVETLVHELAHAAGAPVAGPFMSSWVHEGVADWVAVGQPRNERKPRDSDGRLPRDHEFSTGSQASIIVAYRESRSAISYLSARAGTGAPAAFFQTLGTITRAPGSRSYLTDQALQRSTSLGLAAFQDRWARR